MHSSAVEDLGNLFADWSIPVLLSPRQKRRRLGPTGNEDWSVRSGVDGMALGGNRRNDFSTSKDGSGVGKGRDAQDRANRAGVPGCDVLRRGPLEL